MQRKERTYLQGLALPSHFWLPLLPSYFCPFVSSAFSWHLLLLKRKQKHTHTKKKKMQRREGPYLSSLASTFGMKHSSCFLLCTFLQHWALHLPQALGLTTRWSSVLFKLGRCPQLLRWNEWEMRWASGEGEGR